MEKPIILKQRFRFGWIWAILFALQLGLWVWGFSRDPVGILIVLPGVILVNVSVFFARVTLAENRITVQHSLTDVRRHHFIHILRYLVKPDRDRLNVELTVEQLFPPKSELFGLEFRWFWRKPPSIQERAFSFSIELEQAEITMNYLHDQGAEGDVFAETDWRKLRVLLASNRELRRIEREQGKLSGEQKLRVLRQTEARLLKAEEEL